MIVVCPACASRFQYPDDRFQGVASKRFKCPKCGHVFEMLNPAFPRLAEPGGPAPDPARSSRPPAMADLPPAPTVPAPAGSAAANPAEPGPAAPGQAAPGQARSRFSVPAPATARPAMTTARNKRDAMLAAAGLGPGDMPPDFRFSLAFLTGPLASTVRVLESAATTIGREEGDVIINDPEASRKHARIDIHPDGTAWLTDLGSTNGTSTAGRTIDGPTQLLDRQEFTCGRSTFMLLIRPIDTLSPD